MIYTEPTPAHSATNSESAHDELAASTHEPSDGKLRWLVIQLLSLADFGMFTSTLLSATRITFPNLSQTDLVCCLQFLEREQAILVQREGPGSHISWSVSLTRLGKGLASYTIEPAFELARPRIS